MPKRCQYNSSRQPTLCRAESRLWTQANESNDSTTGTKPPAPGPGTPPKEGVRDEVKKDADKGMKMMILLYVRKTVTSAIRVDTETLHHRIQSAAGNAQWLCRRWQCSCRLFFQRLPDQFFSKSSSLMPESGKTNSGFCRMRDHFAG